MKLGITGILAAAAILGSVSPAAAQDGDYYTFTLFNGTPWTILTFQTGEPNGTYSRDWMPNRVLEPGDSVALRFHDSEDACEYYVKIVFEDGDAWQQKLDFCELESVVVNEDGVIEGIE
ncbi:MAG: hypothetical protein Q8S03_08530 [Brevundimonas sp.]|uniref:hypothetical protein n=1 Tax=Brevundimonas sp. TaxID=1871086 RepID=UPI0027336947|nr:hypothetical protein [Brevundimonas sp.]MDP3404721.1 hypothetical protein [Brevundimonas sp.]